jgi:hypothetical protein
LPDRYTEEYELMTAWEYGYIYVVHTVGPAPAACVVTEGSKSRVLDSCHSFIRAANIVGAKGWEVSDRGERASCTSWINDMIKPIEGVGMGDSMMCYFMRRAIEPSRLDRI